ncbi:hypothetical protein STEG23_012271 [Scotinomys teguina]
MTVMPLGRDQDCSLKNREPDVPALLVPGSWRMEKTTAVGLYFIFPGICTLSLCPEQVKLKKQKCKNLEMWKLVTMVKFPACGQREHLTLRDAEMHS